MIYLSLDLELNQPSGKIIQIGAVVGNLLTGDVLGTFSVLVKIDEDLDEYIINLTGIDEWDLAIDGVPLVEAYRQLLAFRDKFPDCETNPLTWGGGDSAELKQQVTRAYDNIIVGKTFDWPFGRRWIDIKTIFQFHRIANGLEHQAGLAKALTKLKMNFIGSKHDAQDDAYNTFLIACNLLKLLKK